MWFSTNEKLLSKKKKHQRKEHYIYTLSNMKLTMHALIYNTYVSVTFRFEEKPYPLFLDMTASTFRKVNKSGCVCWSTKTISFVGSTLRISEHFPSYKTWFRKRKRSEKNQMMKTTYSSVLKWDIFLSSQRDRSQSFTDRLYEAVPFFSFFKSWIIPYYWILSWQPLKPWNLSFHFLN